MKRHSATGLRRRQVIAVVPTAGSGRPVRTVFHTCLLRVACSVTVTMKRQARHRTLNQSTTRIASCHHTLGHEMAMGMGSLPSTA
ncbi:hypothetical protein BDZ89DRAFT_1062953 [Hymenopellis radicata]|nr:hypothetical protein BDZ89DRAFT_1062953 [Hymenopellis radicata]